jgi:hypothetical protein
VGGRSLHQSVPSFRHEATAQLVEIPDVVGDVEEVMKFGFDHLGVHGLEVLCMLVDDIFDGGQMRYRGIRTEAKQFHKPIGQSKAIDLSAEDASRLDHHIQTILQDWDHIQDLCTEPFHPSRSSVGRPIRLGLNQSALTLPCSAKYFVMSSGRTPCCRKACTTCLIFR